jgi:4-amino-4-deoxy-L-arabinose transferase-like glycosyltransferase
MTSRPASAGRALRREWVLLVLLFAVLAALRLHALGADPPCDLQWHFIGDEGNWTHNARQQILFGHWIIDQMNVPIFGAPLYTLALWAWYHGVGIGLVQTRLLAALSGLGTCALVFAVVRRLEGWGTALIATTLLGVDYFMLSHNRVAFVESFQLFFATAACLTSVLAVERPAWALASGASFVLALGAKVSAATIAPGLALFWVLQLAYQARDRGVRSVSPRAPLLFAAAAATVTGVVAVGVVLPHWETVRAAWSMFGKTADTGNILSNFGLLGIDSELRERTRPGPNGLLQQSWPLLALAAIPAARALVRGGTRWRNPLLAMCACWVVGSLAVLGTQNSAQDRRYLLLLPPLAVLAALGLRSGGLALPSREDASKTRSRWRRFALGAFLGAFAGLYLRTEILPAARAPLSALPIGAHTGLSDALLCLLIWAGCIAAGAGLGPVLWRLLPSRPISIPTPLVLALFVAVNVGRYAWHVLPPSYTMRDASREIARLAERLPPDRRVAVGFAADTFSLSSPLWAFEIRDWDWAHDYSNLDGWSRYHPSLVIGEDPKVPGFEPLPPLEVARDCRGRPRVRLPLWIRSGVLAPEAGSGAAPPP